MRCFGIIVALSLSAVLGASAGTPAAFSNAFVNFESPAVHPIELSPDGARLAVCNVADGKVELFNVTSGRLTTDGAIPVGMDPVSVRFRNASEAWVVNHISDSISVLDVAGRRVIATIQTLDTPSDIVFAGSPLRAFVTCSLPNIIQVFNPDSREVLTNLLINAERPRSLAVSPDRGKVYAAIFESGNATTVVGARFRNFLFFSNAVSLTTAPYGGQNPPPNLGASFAPPLNPALPTNAAPPSGLIVRKNAEGRWLDDNQHDWTEFVSGTNAALTQRIAGWDLPDRDLAIIDSTNYSIGYATGLMNLCMAIGVNPASGRVAVVGTDAINEVRFEPNLNGIFARVRLALVDPTDLTKAIHDLNPHLNYLTRTLPPAERRASIGDPRSIVWTSDGTRGYIAAMGSRNVVVIDANGERLADAPLEVGEGPCGLALDEARHRLYVYNRFSSSVSVIDTATGTVLDAIALFDPTPLPVAAGRRHLYDTRRTSGLGQASCASCHADGRMDRLGWDLGNPAGELLNTVVNNQGRLVTDAYHPMKGVMVTQTLQDIIGHEPFHWRGDRPDIESFNSTFTNLQAASAGLTTFELRELRDFLASIRFPPNSLRNFDNSLSTNVTLNGQVALGDGTRPRGTPLPNGNAVAGLTAFNAPENFCTTCHTLPTGLGLDSALQPGGLKQVPPGPNGEHHFALAVRLEGSLMSKIAQFRNLAEKIGLDGTQAESRAGFGFGHDGSVDSLTRFLNGLRIVPDKDIADLSAFLLSVSGSDTATPSGPVDPSPPAATGRQLTIAEPMRPALIDAMLALALSPTGRVDLIAKGTQSGTPRGWFYLPEMGKFQADSAGEITTVDALIGLAGVGSELTFTVVPRGLGNRLGIDRDLDGILDRDEIDAGTNPADRQLLPRVVAPTAGVAFGTDLSLAAQIPPLPAAGSIAWWKDGQFIVGATNEVLSFPNADFLVTGDYAVVVTTPFQSYTSAPARITIAPLLVTVAPSSQSIRRGSNATFAASVTGLGPFSYQWRVNELELVGAGGSSLMVSNVEVANEGIYRAVVSNAYGAVASPPVSLTVLLNPAVVFPALSQKVVAGADATFSFEVSGHPPPFGFQLRRSTSLLSHYTSSNRIGFLTLPGVQPSNAGTYRIVITNAANPSPGLALDPVTLTVLTDFDGDGLPDEWEAAHGLATNNNADAQSDLDLDGQFNFQEYLAGTDPQDPGSFLKIERLFLPEGESAAVIEFSAASNQTYTVEFLDAFGTNRWQRLADVVAQPARRLIAFTNTLEGTTDRYYRLVAPRVP